jgi:hypothetical protein
MYDKDFYRWALLQTEHIKNREFDKVDFENVAEEIESLGRSDKRSLKSHLEKLLMHMLKIAFQPDKHTKSWDKTFFNSRKKIGVIIDESPSLKREVPNMIDKCFEQAKKDTAFETGLPAKTFPKECPLTLKEVLKG